jgi:hypothetical protein
MKVFVSWSGERSRIVAEGFAAWIKDVLQAVRPFISTADIDRGAVWFNKIGTELETSNFGILVLTAENLGSPWIMFEAGALAKHLEQSRVVPLLVDISPTDLIQPLGQFNAAKCVKADIGKLVHSINKALGETAVAPAALDRAFDRWWPEFEGVISKAHETMAAKRKPRSDREILEELLGAVRGIEKRAAAWPMEPSRGIALKELMTGAQRSGSGIGSWSPVWTQNLQFDPESESLKAFIRTLAESSDVQQKPTQSKPFRYRRKAKE